MKIKDYTASNFASRLQTFREQYARVNQQLNALVWCNQDPESEIEKYYQQVTPDSLLGYNLVVVKDNFSTRGIPTTASSKILENYIPPFDATAVRLLHEAGALVVAKSSMDELGMGGTNTNALTGKVYNPYDAQRIAGGSSGGSAVSVAANLCAVALGSDTGDSVRKPAAYNGVVGMKPSYGLISRYGLIPYASSLDHVGYFTSDVSDAATVLKVLAQYDPLDGVSVNCQHPDYQELSSVVGLKVKILQNVVEQSDPRIVEMFEELVQKLSGIATVDRYTFNQPLFDSLLPVYYIIANAEAFANHSNLDGVRFGLQATGEDLAEIITRSRTEGFSTQVKTRFIFGAYALEAENQQEIFLKAQKIRRLIVEEYQRMFGDFDIVLTIATTTVAPTFDQAIGDNLSDNNVSADNHLLLGNFSGFPSITIPLGMVDGMPVAVSLTAKYLEDHKLLKAAKMVEELIAIPFEGREF